jgi:hypothetical protein
VETVKKSIAAMASLWLRRKVIQILAGSGLLWGPIHPARDRSFGNSEAEHEEFAVDARSSPGRAFGHHLEDQIANFLGYGSSSEGLPDLGDHHPVPTETGAVPSDHSFGCDNQECLLPAGPAAANDQPEEPVGQIEPWAWMTAFQHKKLLA